MDFQQYYESRKKLVNNFLEKRMEKRGISNVDDAMKYSLLAGGKRLRPILLMATAEAVGANGYDFLPAACGLEMIHTYSLIHDDLPCMDNDDYRRGRLTNHKVFGEAMAVLAGDGLLTLAFEVMLRQQGVSADTLVRVVREISTAAGPDGMVGGQALDMESEDKQISMETMKNIHLGKTGALFRAAIRSGAILGGASEEALAALTVYADNFGLAFQITDDILDVIGDESVIGKPVGSDEKNHKSTYVTLTSLEEAQKLAQDAVDTAIDALKIFGGEADFLRELVAYLVKRNK